MPTRPLGRRIKDTKCFSGTSLFFAVLVCLACSAVIPALGGGRAATIGGAVLAPVLVALATTRGRGPIRGAGIAALTGVALVISIAGFTVPEVIRGNGSLTGTGSGTFLRTERFPTPTPPQPWPWTPHYAVAAAPPTTAKPLAVPAAPEVDVPDERKCPNADVGTAKTCKSISIRNIGPRTVELATGDVEGDDAVDFILTKACDGMLKPGTACSIRIRYQPIDPGTHAAFIVLHVKPGNYELPIALTGTAAQSA
jgi:hypothetical protein